MGLGSRHASPRRTRRSQINKGFAHPRNLHRELPLNHITPGSNSTAQHSTAQHPLHLNSVVHPKREKRKLYTSRWPSSTHTTPFPSGCQSPNPSTPLVLIRHATISMSIHATRNCKPKRSTPHGLTISTPQRQSSRRKAASLVLLVPPRHAMQCTTPTLTAMQLLHRIPSPRSQLHYLKSPAHDTDPLAQNETVSLFAFLGTTTLLVQ